MCEHHANYLTPLAGKIGEPTQEEKRTWPGWTGEICWRQGMDPREQNDPTLVRSFRGWPWTPLHS